MPYLDQHKIRLEPEAFEWPALRRIVRWIWWPLRWSKWRLFALLGIWFASRAIWGGFPFGDPLVFVVFLLFPPFFAGRPEREDLKAVSALYRAVALFLVPMIVLAPDQNSRIFSFIVLGAVAVSWLVFDVIHGFRRILEEAEGPVS